MNNSHHVPTTPLTAPNRTLQAPEPSSSSSRRFLQFNRNKDSSPNIDSPVDVNVPLSPLPRSPSLELSDSFAALSATVASPTVSTPLTTKSSPYLFNSKYNSRQQTLHNASIDPPVTTEAYNPFFSASQLISIKSICSDSNVTDWSFLSTEKYPSTLSQQDTVDLEMSTVGLSIELAANNIKTRNFNRLVDHLLGLFQQMQKAQQHEAIIPVEMYNALLLTRMFIKQFAGNLSNQEIINQLEDDVADSRGEQLIEYLLYTLTNMDPTSSHSAYEFYTEVLNTFFTLLSTQLFQPYTTEAEEERDDYFLDILMAKFNNRAETIVARLFENIIAQHLPPPQSAAGALYSAYNYFFSSGRNVHQQAQDSSSPPVAERSLLLLLLLGNQHNEEWNRSYRRALAYLNDHHVISSDMDSCDGGKMHLISFKNLLDMLLNSIHVEEKMLLFYLILVENESFRVYVLSRTDQESIYLPILKTIYTSMEDNNKFHYTQIYILLVILLIFSQDDVNNEAIQKTIVYNITWFTERPLLKSISLGGLMILVLLRALQSNLSQKRDIFLHTNCLAILLNMSSTLYDMHSYIAQRIISIFEVLAKRYTKTMDKQQQQQQSQDMLVFEDLLVLLLEMMNSTLSYRLKQNTQLVYALLQKREIFVPFQANPRFMHLVKNIDEVILHFSARVAEANLKAPSSTEVLRLIEQATRTWSNHKLILLPNLKFTYNQEPTSVDFFIPYIWALIQKKHFIYWSESRSHILEAYRFMNQEFDE